MSPNDDYIFDLYGTLVDILTDEDDPAVWRAAADAYTAVGAVYTAEELKRAYDRLVQEDIDRLRAKRDLRRGEYIEPSLRRVFARLFEEKNAAAVPEEIERIGWQFRTASTRRLRLYDGAEEVLRELRRRGHRLYLLSNAQDIFTRPELELLGISEAFDGIVLSSEAGIKKPAAGIFRILCRRFGIDPERAVMVGNDPVCDAAAAHAVGMRSIYIHTAQSPDGQAQLPEDCRRIHKIREVPAVNR